MKDMPKWSVRDTSDLVDLVNHNTDVFDRCIAKNSRRIKGLRVFAIFTTLYLLGQRTLVNNRIEELEREVKELKEGD